MATKTKRQPDPEIIHEGSQIILPASPKPMTTGEAIQTLERKLADEETILDVHEMIDAHPYDGLVAFNWAMKEVYGWASPQPKPGFFGEVAPDMMTIKTGPKDEDFVQVPHGRFKLPNIEAPIDTHFDFRANAFHVTGKVKKKDRDFLARLCNVARERLRTHSIFMGKAITIPVDSDGDAEFHDIKFIETDHIRPNELILNPGELDQIESALWTPIRHTTACEEMGIPLNRGILLEGTYGTGKTMTSTVTAKIAVDSGWTYIFVEDVEALEETLRFAKRYQPCVVFAEDVDRVADERDQSGNDLINTIDGILSKDSKVITVMTTNHVEKLEKAMLRPGRIDAAITVRPPEAEAVKRLIHLYARGKLVADANLDGVAEKLAGNIPATIREVVERSKLAMIRRAGENIGPDDLTAAADWMEEHLNLLKVDKPEKGPAERFGAAFLDMLDLDGIEGVAKRMDSTARQGVNAMRRVVNSASEMEGVVREFSEESSTKLDDIKKDTTEIKKAL